MMQRNQNNKNYLSQSASAVAPSASSGLWRDKMAGQSKTEFLHNDRLKARVAGTPIPVHWGGWKYLMKKNKLANYFSSDLSIPYLSDHYSVNTLNQINPVNPVYNFMFFLTPRYPV